MRTLLLACIGFLGLLPGSMTAATQTHQRFNMEIVVRTGESVRNRTDAEELVASARRHGVTVINLLVKQDEDRPISSGLVYYDSKLAPKAPGYEQFDALQVMLDLMRPTGIKLRAWIPQFHDQIAAKRNLTSQMMALKGGQIEPFKGSRNTEYFVNPLDPQAQAYQRALIEEVAAKYSIDGIILDWLRFDDYPMDLSPTTRERFQQQTGVDPVTIDFSRPSQARERWNAFRTDGIGAYVNDVRRSLRPEVMLGVFILPPDFVEVGQDSAKFNDKSQVLAPMCYSRDWGFPLNWIWNRCLASTVNKAGDATVLPTLDSGLHDNEYRQIMRRIRRDFPNIRAIAWFHHGKWNDDLMRHLSKVSSW